MNRYLLFEGMSESLKRWHVAASVIHIKGVRLLIAIVVQSSILFIP